MDATEHINAFANAFGVWAAVVGMIGVAIVWELSRLRSEVRNMLDQLNEHMMDTEHRMTALEAFLQQNSTFNPKRNS